MAKGWHILRDGAGLTLARRLPPRFDLVAETLLPPADPLGLAHQIRQDVWRALRRLRGFSPVVEIRETAAGLCVRAGGEAPNAPPGARARIQAVLDNASNRRRWRRCAAFIGETA